MSGRILYVERAEGKSGTARLRLVGERHDEALDTGTVLSPEECVAWLSERLPKGPGGGPWLDVVCTDAQGSLCAWMTTPTIDQNVIDVLARERAGNPGDTGEGDEGATVLGVYAGVPQDSSVQVLALEPAAPARKPFSRGPRPPQERRRVPVLATADVDERLLLDALDKQGASVGAVCSLWHSMAAAWDPKPDGREAAAAGRVVVSEAVPVACVLLDPRGRLLWTWSQGGSLVAAGSILLRRTPGESPVPCVFAHDVSRLAAEWLSWSAQLNVAPQRVVAVVPTLVAENPGELDAGGLGEAIGRAWHGAAVDLAVDDDPLGTTFRRLAARATNAQESGAPTAAIEPTHTLVGLSRRPGRAHFRLYVWAALAVAVGAAGIGVEAWSLRADARAAQELADQTAKQWREEFNGLKLTTAALPGQELLVLEGELAKKQKELRPEGVVPAKPILQELETLSYVLSLEEFDLTEISLDSRSTSRMSVLAPSLRQGEQLFEALQHIGGSSLTWRTQNYDAPRPSDGKVRCQFTADWATPPTRPPAPATNPENGA